MRTFAASAALFILVPATAAASVSLDGYASVSNGFSKAVSAAGRGRVHEAVSALDGIRDSGEVPSDALDYSAGRALERAGRLSEALARYSAIEKGLLSDSALFRKARILERLGDTTGARVAYSKISRSSAHWTKARLGLAEHLVAEGRPSLAIAALREMLARDLTGWGRHEARLAYARALNAAGREDDAMRVATAAFMNATTDGRARSAATVLAELGKRPSRLSRKLQKALHASGRRFLQLSRSAARRPRSFTSLDKGLPYFVRGRYALDGARDAKLAVKRLAKALDTAVDPSVREWAAYHLARALDRTGSGEKACDLFRGVFEDGGTAAPQSAMRLAGCMARAGDFDGATAVMKKVVSEYPDSGLANQALWKMALAAIMSDRWDSALTLLDRGLTHLDQGDGVLFHMAEKLRYFRGVALLELGRGDEGTADLQRVARSFPHSWFGVLAVTRLANMAGDREAFARGIQGPGLVGVPTDTPGFTRRSAALAPRFDAGGRAIPAGGTVQGPVMLWRLGYRKEALRETRSRADRGLLDEDGLAVLGAMIAGGRSPRGAMYSRKYLRGWPAPWNRDVFTAAYPRPFTALVNEAARSTGLDPAFIYGVMRTESNFNARARSGVGAIGIMQLMPRTARVVASKLVNNPGLARRLRTPGPNILLGSTFLAELGRHFRGHLPLVLSGYNAGAGAARSFMRRFSNLATDIFVEAVPYPATAAFIKRVIGYAAGYRAMYDDTGRGPFLVSMEVPDTPGPYMEDASRK